MAGREVSSGNGKRIRLRRNCGRVQARSYRRKLLILFLMAVFSQSFLTLMRRNLMTLTFFTTRHTQFFFLLKNKFQ